MTSNLRNKIVVSGIRSTGKLHLGNYHGALKQWLSMQDKYTCFFFAADLHGLTTNYATAGDIPVNTRTMVEDWLAAGLDHENCCIFVQSDVPEHSELHLLFSMFTPLSWLERIPTYKDQQAKLSDKDLSTYGFLGYPLLQAADVLLYNADLVPVGEDQLAHLELVRKIARRFNFLYGNSPSFEAEINTIMDSIDKKQAKKLRTLKRDYQQKGLSVALENATRLTANLGLEQGMQDSLCSYVAGTGKTIINLPEPLLSVTPKLPGTDGQKMSKSYNNTIALTEAEPDVRKKIKSMPTDPARVKRTDPGEPSKCPVWELHKVYANSEIKDWVINGCRTAKIGCIDCKSVLADSIVKEQAPIIERSKDYRDNPIVDKILSKGAERARDTATTTLRKLKLVMHSRDN